MQSFRSVMVVAILAGTGGAYTIASAPGVTSTIHKHPGEEINYVLEGQLEYTVAGKPPVLLTLGDVLFVPAGTLHSARNPGRVTGSELATYVVEKGTPLIVVPDGKP
jgi:quercetin dioxygenase-like cupin family protein